MLIRSLPARSRSGTDRPLAVLAGFGDEQARHRVLCGWRVKRLIYRKRRDWLLSKAVGEEILIQYLVLV
jgi:hypothetical protein